MKSIFTLLFSTLFLVVQSQEIIYTDQFDDEVLSVGNDPNGYTLNLGDSTFQISGNGSAGPWTAMTYSMHDGANNPILVNASENPKLYIRAKGENQPNLRIDLQDETGYVTNQNPLEVSLDNNYTVYEFNYIGRLNDGAYGGPCTVGPCPVDASKIQGLVLFVNAPNGGYGGTIEIDWISIGAPLGNSGVASHEIRYNQVSYLTDRQKLISVVANLPFSNLPYAIYREGDPSPVMEGLVSNAGIWSASQEYVGTVDFSSLNEAGNYSFQTPEKSINFSISSNGYDELCAASIKYYYYNRASQELLPEYAGPWARPLGHPDDEVIVHFSAASSSRPTGTIISAPKGWYDAGDYNKYIVNSGISTYTLLAAYEHYPEYYQELNVDIPEQGGDLPDLLDEVIWNLDWMLSMQDPEDGGVYHKLTGLNFSGIIMPHQYNFDRYVVQKTTSAALNFAAVMAVASRIFAEYEDAKPGYSATLITAAAQAYDWAKANPTIYYNQPSNVNTGQYGDGNVSDEFDWAASELFITTGGAEYRADINESQIGDGVPAWPYTAPLALISLAQHADLVSDDIDVNIIASKLLATADQLKSATNQSAMRVAMGASNGDFVWGSNGQAGNQIMMLIRAYEWSDDESYLDAAFLAMDYLLGRNGTGFCYVSGFGDKSPRRPHHRQSEADNVSDPVPGMVAGGPNPGQQDACPGYLGNLPASSYVDSWCSYASNEVTINWNAPMAYAINALRFYQTELTTSIEETDAVKTSPLSIVPNPGKNTVYLPQINDRQEQHLEIVDLVGQVVYQQKGITNPNLDLSSLSAGIYLFRLFEGHKVFTSKWVKVN
ncbi:MAG: glycoside hydrolase family 9 protein [Bacteroidota bacterium]